jgi:large subunit ribosomal protein L17
MRHGMANRKLGRTSSHRKALFRNQVASMIEHERIITTLIKAKELRPIVEKMVTLAKNDSVHNRRQATQSLAEAPLVQKLFGGIAPRFATRPGGYTRIVKLGPRRGDGAEMAILEFVDYQLQGAAETSAAKTDKKGAKPKKEAAAPAGEEKAAAPAKKKPAAKKPAAAKKEAAPKKKAAPKKEAAAKPKTKKKKA